MGLGRLKLELRGIKEKESWETPQLGSMNVGINYTQPNKIIFQLLLFVFVHVCVYTYAHKFHS